MSARRNESYALTGKRAVVMWHALVALVTCISVIGVDLISSGPYYADDDEELKLEKRWDRPLGKWNQGQGFTALAVNAESGLIATGAWYGMILWDAKTGCRILFDEEEQDDLREPLRGCFKTILTL